MSRRELTKAKAYKQLRKKLSKKFVNPYKSMYCLFGGVWSWVEQSGIKVHTTHMTVIVEIFGTYPYPYQKADRKKILKYLKNNKKLLEYGVHE